MAQRGQRFLPPRQRLAQQAASGVIEQIKHDVAHRAPAPRLANAPGVGQTMPAQQPRQIGPAVGVECHQLTVHEGPRHGPRQEDGVAVAGLGDSLAQGAPLARPD